jgi:hypothetical protein
MIFHILASVLNLSHGFESSEHGPRLARRVESEGGEAGVRKYYTTLD